MHTRDKNFEKLQKTYGKDFKLFAVYGTLRIGCGNHGIITSGRRNFYHLGTIETDPIYNMYDIGYFPGVTEGGETPIVMEVYGISNTGIQDRLDTLEGYRGEEYNDPAHPHSNFYNRKEIDTPWGPAFLYVYNGVPYRKEKLIKTGDWMNHTKVPSDVKIIPWDTEVNINIKDLNQKKGTYVIEESEKETKPV